MTWAAEIDVFPATPSTRAGWSRGCGRASTGQARRAAALLLTEFLRTRVLELAVHGLDLAAGLGRQPWMTAAAARVAEDLVLPAGTTAQLLGESGWDHITLIARATGRLSLTAAETTMIERPGIHWLSLG